MSNSLKSLRARALNYLAKRDYSRDALAKKLRQSRNPVAPDEALIEQVLEECCAQSWINDRRYAEQFSQHYAARYGARRLAQRLHEQGISREWIQEALEKLPDEHERARQVWRKKFNTRANDPKTYAKQARFLASRGFSFSVIQSVLRTPNQEE